MKESSLPPDIYEKERLLNREELDRLNLQQPPKNRRFVASAADFLPDNLREALGISEEQDATDEPVDPSLDPEAALIAREENGDEDNVDIQQLPSGDEKAVLAHQAAIREAARREAMFHSGMIGLGLLGKKAVTPQEDSDPKNAPPRPRHSNISVYGRT